MVKKCFVFFVLFWGFGFGFDFGFGFSFGFGFGFRVISKVSRVSYWFSVKMSQQTFQCRPL